MSAAEVAVDEPLVIVTDQDAVDAKIRSLQRDNPFQPDSPLSHQAEDIIKASTITRSFIEMHDPELEGDSPRTDRDTPDGVIEEDMIATSASPAQHAAPPAPGSSPASPASDAARSNGEAEPTGAECSKTGEEKKKKKKKKGCVIL